MSVRELKKFLRWSDKNIVVCWKDELGDIKRGTIGVCQFMWMDGDTPLVLMERIIEWNKNVSGMRDECIFHFWNRVVETRIGPVMVEVDERGMSPMEVLESYKNETK